MLTNPVIAQINQQQLLTNRIAFKVGDTIAVVIRVIEGGKERLQTFQGVVIAINNRGLHSSFIVRKVSHGTGVERTFMLHSRAIQEIRMVRTGLVRQAKIYYMRERSGKSARIAERFDKKPTAAKIHNDATATEPTMPAVATEEAVTQETVTEEIVAEVTSTEENTTKATTTAETVPPTSETVDDGVDVKERP